MIRVAVAATSPIMRAGLEAIIASSPDCVVVGRATAGSGLAEEIATLRPDVTLLDLDPHAGDDALPDLADLAAPVVALSESAQSTLVAEALRAGQVSLLPREATAEEILAAVRATAAGLVTLHHTMVAAIAPHLPAVARDAPALPPGQPLTPREVEVLQMLADGLGNKTIARRMGISEHTVKFHVGSILAKLNAGSRTEAVTLAARQGLILL